MAGCICFSKRTSIQNENIVLIDICEKTRSSVFPKDAIGYIRFIKEILNDTFSIQLKQWLGRRKSLERRHLSSGSSKLSRAACEENSTLRMMLEDMDTEGSAVLSLSLKIVLYQHFTSTGLGGDSSHTEVDKLAAMLSGTYQLACSDSGALIVSRSDALSLGEDKMKTIEESFDSGLWQRSEQQQPRLYLGSVTVSACALSATFELERFIKGLERGSSLERISSSFVAGLVRAKTMIC